MHAAPAGRVPQRSTVSDGPAPYASGCCCGWSHCGGLVAAVGGYGETQALPVLIVLTVCVPQGGVQSEAAGLLGVQVGGGPDPVFVRGVVRLVVHHVVIDDVDPVKGGRVGQAPLAF